MASSKTLLLTDPSFISGVAESNPNTSTAASGTIGNIAYQAAVPGYAGNGISVSHVAAPYIAKKASATISGITYTAKIAGSAGNSIKVSHVSAAIVGTNASAIIGGMTYTCRTAGTAGNGISIVHSTAAVSSKKASCTVSGMTYTARTAGSAGNQYKISIGASIVFAKSAFAYIGGLSYTAFSAGSAGNSISVTAISGAPGSALAASLSGKDITISIPPSGATGIQVKDALYANASIRSLVTVTGQTSALHNPVSKTFLSGGSDDVPGPISASISGYNISVLVPAGTTNTSLKTFLESLPAVGGANGIIDLSNPSGNVSTTAQPVAFAGGQDASNGILFASILNNRISILVPPGTTNAALKTFLESKASIAGTTGVIDLSNPSGDAPTASGPTSLQGGTNAQAGALSVAYSGGTISVSIPSGATNAQLKSYLDSSSVITGTSGVADISVTIPAGIAAISAPINFSGGADPVAPQATVTVSGKSITVTAAPDATPESIATLIKTSQAASALVVPTVQSTGAIKTPGSITLAGGIDKDPYISNVSLLVTGNGVTGSNVRTMRDDSGSSISNIVRIARGDPLLSSLRNSAYDVRIDPSVCQGPLSPFNSGSSMYFSGSGHGISVQADTTSASFSTAAKNAYQLTGDFTAEAWVYIQPNSWQLPSSGQYYNSGNPYDYQDQTIFSFGSSIGRVYFQGQQRKYFSAYTYGLFFGKDNSLYFSWCDNVASADRTPSSYHNVRTPAGSLPYGQWCHVAVSRQGNNLRLFINGVLLATYGNPIVLPQDDTLDPDSLEDMMPSSGVKIGTKGPGGPSALEALEYCSGFKGYMADIRITKSAVYTSTFGIPAGTLASLPNTILLLNCKNYGFSSAVKPHFLCSKDMSYIGNPAATTLSAKIVRDSLNCSKDSSLNMIVSAPAKWNSGSLKLNNMTVMPSDALNLGGADFTFESWVYIPSEAGVSGVRKYYIANLVPEVGNNEAGAAQNFSVYLSCNGSSISYMTMQVLENSATSVGSASLAASQACSLGTRAPVNAWNHFAVSRVGNSIMLFCNGTLIGLTTYSKPITAGKQALAMNIIESSGSCNNTSVFYINDYRVTRGMARYSAGFTVPGGPLPIS
jgi:hypothetical protein